MTKDPAGNLRLHLGDESGDVNIQPISEMQQCAEGGIHLSSLQMSHVRSVEAAAVGQLLLAEAKFVASLPDAVTYDALSPFGALVSWTPGHVSEPEVAAL